MRWDATSCCHQRCPHPGVSLPSIPASGRARWWVSSAARREAPATRCDGIDLVLYANWLAETGDLILHAVRRPCSTGQATASPGRPEPASRRLPRPLPRPPGQLCWERTASSCARLEGRFWIFGTPWHEDPARCSPLGAPLKELFFLDRADGHGLWPCAPAGRHRAADADGFYPLLSTRSSRPDPGQPVAAWRNGCRSSCWDTSWGPTHHPCSGDRHGRIPARATHLPSASARALCNVREDEYATKPQAPLEPIACLPGESHLLAGRWGQLEPFRRTGRVPTLRQ